MAQHPTRILFPLAGLGVVVQILDDRKRVVQFDPPPAGSGTVHRYNQHSWPKLSNSSEKHPPQFAKHAAEEEERVQSLQKAKSAELDADGKDRHGEVAGFDPEAGWKVASTVMAAARLFVAAAEVMHQQGCAQAPKEGWRARLGLPGNLLAWLRLYEAREQLQYTLIRERFVLIPMSLHSARETAMPETFDFNEYLLQCCCEQVRSAIHIQWQNWALLIVAVASTMEFVAFTNTYRVLMLLIGWLLWGAALGLLHALRGMLSDLTPHHPLLVSGNQLHIPACNPHEKLGVVSHVPLPPYLTAGHAAAASAHGSAGGSGARRSKDKPRWNRHQALWAVHLSGQWRALAEKLDVGRSGRFWMLQAQSYLLLFSSVFSVIVLEEALSGTPPLWVLGSLLPIALLIIVTMPSVVYYSAYVANIEMLRGQQSIDMTCREMKLKQGLRVLKVLHQLRTFGERTPTKFARRPTLRKVSQSLIPEAVTRTISRLLSGGGIATPVERQESGRSRQGGVEYLSDALRVAEWREIFELMDLAEATSMKEEKAAFNQTFAEIVADAKPSAAWVQEERAGGMGGDGTLSLLEFAFFMCKQRCENATLRLKPCTLYPVPCTLYPRCGSNHGVVAACLACTVLVCTLPALPLCMLLPHAAPRAPACGIMLRRMRNHATPHAESRYAPACGITLRRCSD